MELIKLYPSQCHLAESPFWHERRKSYLWVDIAEDLLYELEAESGSIRKWEISSRPSVILEHTDGSLILGVQGGLVKFGFEREQIDWLLDIDRSIPSNRCNDGACDLMGRIWIGTMDLNCAAGRGSLYCMDSGFQLKKKIDNLTIPNGLCWSLGNERMYFIDSTTAKIRSYLYNNQNAELFFEKDAVVVPDGMGLPDGMTIDVEGMLWVALYGGSCICRWNPKTAELLARIEIPAPNVTSCCFVGPHLEDLMITTAREHLGPGELQDYPESGDVFLLKNTGTKGLKNNKTSN